MDETTNGTKLVRDMRTKQGNPKFKQVGLKATEESHTHEHYHADAGVLHTHNHPGADVNHEHPHSEY